MNKKKAQLYLRQCELIKDIRYTLETLGDLGGNKDIHRYRKILKLKYKNAQRGLSKMQGNLLNKGARVQIRNLKNFNTHEVIGSWLI